MSLFLGFRSGFRSSTRLPLGAIGLGLLALVFTPERALAAETDDTEESAGGEAAASNDAEDESANEESNDSKDEGKAEDARPKEESDTPSSPPKTEVDSVWEDPKETYLFIGARYRIQRVPQFLQNLFAEGGAPLWVHTPGLEFGMRKDGVETNIFAMLGMYSMNDVPFKGKTDPELAWELVDTNYKVLFLGADFMWSTSEFTKGLSLVYGAGIGLGLVFGDMNRTQSYPNANGDGGFTKCNGAFDPAGLRVGVGQYCDAANDHYNGYVEPSWTDDGSSPLIFPWLGGQVGLRYKVHKHFVARLEVGVTITSLFFGLGADYGL